MMPSFRDQMQADLRRYNWVYFGEFHAARFAKGNHRWCLSFKGDEVRSLSTTELLDKMQQVNDANYYGVA